MKRAIQCVSIAVMALGSVACASSGSGGSSATFREDMGRLLAEPLDEAQLKIWGKHTIPIYRKEESPNQILYESQWMPRAPTPAEAAEGVTAARNRVIIRARRIEGEMDMISSVYRVTFEVNNEVRSALQPDWHGGPMPDAPLERFRRVLSDMNLELRTGVRR